MIERGQTTYDYLLGILLLLIAVTTVFWLFPQITEPFFDPVTSDREKMADQFAAEVIEANATLSGERTLDVETSTFDDAYVAEMKNRSGLQERRKVNLSLRKDGEINVSTGPPEPSGEVIATSVRTVRTVPESGLGDYTKACDLVVRVW